MRYSIASIAPKILSNRTFDVGNNSDYHYTHMT